MFWYFCLAAVFGYALGYRDGCCAKPPEPLKGNYEHCEDPEDDESIF